MRNGAGFPGSGAAPVASLPVDDALKSLKTVFIRPILLRHLGHVRIACRQKHQCLETAVNLPFPGITRMFLNGCFRPCRFIYFRAFIGACLFREQRSAINY
jgi:hypothetical protein